jgi:cbb3-type cytochrome oxidase subunit 1
MNRIADYFLIAAASFLVVGVALGIWMGVTQQFGQAHVHAHINLIGWASLALFGLVYRSYPQLAVKRLAKAHFVLSIVGAAVFLPGLPLAVAGVTPVPAIIGSNLWLLGALCFLSVVVTGLLAAPARRASGSVPV